MPEIDRRLCTKCSKKLRPYNQTDTCSSCKRGVGAGDELEPDEAGGGRSSSTAVLKRFRTFTKLVGLDPDALLADFAAGYLERIKRSASSFGEADD